MDLQSNAFGQLGDARLIFNYREDRKSEIIIYCGAEREVRTLETSLEDSHVSNYIISAKVCRSPDSWQDSNHNHFVRSVGLCQ